MAMNGNDLGTVIAGIITASNAPSEMKAQILDMWKQIGTAIVSHIQQNAQVNSGIAVQVSTNSGTGATTAPGTIK
jgi:hypothetical protein